MTQDNCECSNKEEIYVCEETPTGTECTPVGEVPECFKRSVTFVEQ